MKKVNLMKISSCDQQTQLHSTSYIKSADTLLLCIFWFSKTDLVGINYGGSQKNSPTCHPASMLLRSLLKEPARIHICVKLNSLATSTFGLHTFMVALDP